ncbi:helix-turn-helix domain-containing protein [Vagococcus sp.]|uniref:helix-turn-helix domain-containing protein n=1 Tax=Vagococcus sp. TaxID=1933889 RepID=UPI003F962215
MLKLTKEKDLYTLYLLSYFDKTSLIELSELLYIPTRTVKEGINRLNQTFMSKDNPEKLIISNHKGDIYFNKHYDSKKILIINQIQLHYLKESPVFNLLVLLANYYQLSTQEVCDKLFISESYLRKLVKVINRAISRYSFRLRREKNFYFFDGNELNIRLFLYHVVKDTYQNIEWPFETKVPSSFQLTDSSDKAEFNTLYPSTSRKNSIAMFILINDVRVKNNKEIDIHFSNTLKDILKIILCNNHSLNLFKNKLLSEETSPKTENDQLAFSFLTHLHSASNVTDNEKRNIARQLLEHDSEYVQLAATIIEKSSTALDVNISYADFLIQIYHLVYYFVIHLIVGDIWFDIRNLIPLYPTSVRGSITDTETQTIMILIEKEMKTSFLKDIFTNRKSYSRFVHFLSHLLKSYKQEKIAIKLNFSKNVSYSFLIQKKLKAYFSSDLIQFTNHIERADLIITDSLDIYDEKTETFLLTSIFCPYIFEQLISKINQLATHKNII